MTCLCSQTFIAQDLSCSQRVKLDCKLFECGEAAVELEELAVTRRAWATGAADARAGRLRRDGPELWPQFGICCLLAPARVCELGVRLRVPGQVKRAGVRPDEVVAASGFARRCDDGLGGA
jgi:hypothetical protein